MEETTTLRIFERKIVRKIYGPIKEKRMLENKNKQGDHGQGKDMVKFTKSL